MASSSINFSINGTVLTYQPSGISEIYPETSVFTTLSGNRVIVESSAGPVIEVTWGVDAARSEVVNELRTKRSNSGSLNIGYIDATSGTVTRSVYMPKVPYDQFLLTNAIQPMTLQFYTL